MTPEPGIIQSSQKWHRNQSNIHLHIYLLRPYLFFSIQFISLTLFAEELIILDDSNFFFFFSQNCHSPTKWSQFEQPTIYTLLKQPIMVIMVNSWTSYHLVYQQYLAHIFFCFLGIFLFLYSGYFLNVPHKSLIIHFQFSLVLSPLLQIYFVDIFYSTLYLLLITFLLILFSLQTLNITIQ